MASIVALILLAPHGQHLGPTAEELSSYQIAVTSCWLGFTVVNAYYGGAHTMFFASDHGFAFQSMRDVLDAVPEWSIKFLDGNAFMFRLHVMSSATEEERITGRGVFGTKDLGNSSFFSAN